MTNLLTFEYWFNLQPAPLIPSVWNAFIGAVVLLLAASVLLAFLKMRPGLYRGTYKRLYAFGVGNFLIGLLFIFFNYQTVPFFSARFWIAVWALVMLIWLVLVLRGFGQVAKKRQEFVEEQARRKYLP